KRATGTPAPGDRAGAAVRPQPRSRSAMTNPEPTDPPAAQGFRMPAEWEPHAATWLAWPHRLSDWPRKFAPIPWVYAEIVRVLSRHEAVKLVVRDMKMMTQVRKLLTSAGADLSMVSFHTLATDRSWVRDSGPIIVVNGAGERAVL